MKKKSKKEKIIDLYDSGITSIKDIAAKTKIKYSYVNLIISQYKKQKGDQKMGMIDELFKKKEEEPIKQEKETGILDPLTGKETNNSEKTTLRGKYDEYEEIKLLYSNEMLKVNSEILSELKKLNAFFEKQVK